MRDRLRFRPTNWPGAWFVNRRHADRHSGEQLGRRREDSRRLRRRRAGDSAAGVLSHGEPGPLPRYDGRHSADWLRRALRAGRAVAGSSPDASPDRSPACAKPPPHWRAVSLTEVSVHGRNEIAELATNFNIMSGEIAAREKRIVHLAQHDQETGLPNLRALKSACDQPAATHDPSTIFGAALGIDRFDHVRSAIGHTLSARVIAEIAERISDAHGELFVGRMTTETIAWSLSPKAPMPRCAASRTPSILPLNPSVLQTNGSTSTSRLASAATLITPTHACRCSSEPKLRWSKHVKRGGA